VIVGVCIVSHEDLAVAFIGCTACIGLGPFRLFVPFYVPMFVLWLTRIYSQWVAQVFSMFGIFGSTRVVHVDTV